MQKKTMKLTMAVATLPLLLGMLVACGSPKTNGSAAAPVPDANGVITLDKSTIGTDGDGREKTKYMAYTQTADLSKGDYFKQVQDNMAEMKLHSDFVNQVIADKKITGAEMNQAERQALDCASQQGLTLGVDYWLKNGGEWNIYGRDISSYRAMDIMVTCGSNNGYETLMKAYTQAIANPDDIDLEPYRVQCYKDLKVLDPKVTYRQFEDTNVKFTMPTSYKDPRWKDYNHCTDDPLHTMTSKTPAQ